MLNCTSESRRWAGHATALQTSADGNAKTTSRSRTRPKEHAVWPSEHVATRKKRDCPSAKKPTNATDKYTHQKMTWTKRHTQNKKFNWRINKSKSYFRFWTTVHKHERVPKLDCTRHRATDVSWWERNDVPKIQISSITETVRNCDELRPNYVLHKKSCRDPGDVGSADTFVYARSVCDPIWSCDCSTVRH